MRRLPWAIPFLAVAMYATNPGAETHRAVIVDHVHEKLPPAPRARVERSTLDRLLRPHFSYGNYGLVSVGRIKGSAATVGVLGQVVPADPAVW